MMIAVTKVMTLFKGVSRINRYVQYIESKDEENSRVYSIFLIQFTFLFSLFHKSNS